MTGNPRHRHTIPAPGRLHRRRRARGTLAAVVGLALLAAACGDDEPGTSPAGTSPGGTTDGGPAATTSPGDRPTLTLVTYDSFPVEGTTLNDALDAFTTRTGIEVELLVAGDTGTMVAKALLTAGNPEGDVMWGVDNTLLSRAAPAFEPHVSTELDALDPDLVALVPDGALTPVDRGDVCVNYDREWFADNGLEPPASFDDLADPAYRDLLTVQDPAASSPGLAFLLATVAEFGEDGWLDYWARLVDNGVEVVDSWSTAYYERFSGSSGAGPRPLVVSYASSPPAEVIFADPPRTDAPTAVVTATCFRQVEFAGVLAGTPHPDEARRLVDFLVSAEFQREIPLNLFVWPARTDVELPQEFVDFVEVVGDPLTLAPEVIDAGREAWLDAWTEQVLR